MIIANLAENKKDNVPVSKKAGTKIIPQVDRGDKIDRETKASRKSMRDSYQHYSCHELCGRTSPCGNKACSNYRGKK